MKLTGLRCRLGWLPWQPQMDVRTSPHPLPLVWLLAHALRLLQAILLQFAGLGAASGGSECELTELKAMLGVVGEQRYVAGFLTQVQS